MGKKKYSTRKNTKRKNTIKHNRYTLRTLLGSEYFLGFLAFIIPAVIFIAAYIGLKVFPFGERAAMIIDSYHQYVPFFSELHNKIWSGDSLLYSWHGSLGYNFIAVQAYYLASPLNLLIALFPSALMVEAFECMIILKLCIACYTAFRYLRRRKKRADYSMVIFAGFYALGGFSIAYNWNVMWLDCIALFPLVVWGVEKYIEERDWRLYTIALGLTIFSNYYMAIMVCVFVVLYYFAVWFGKKRSGIKDFFCAGIRFAGCSLIAGGMGCVYLLPTYYVMINSSQGSPPTKLEIYQDFFEILRQHFVLIEPTQLDGAPNIYCGVLTGMLIFFFLAARHIGLREKVARLLLASFVLVSTNINVLDYVWHGFHFPNNLPARFSFIYIFLMVAMAYDGWISIRLNEKRVLPVLFALEAVWFGVCVYYPSEEMEFKSIVLTGALIVIYALLLICHRWHLKLSIKRLRIYPRYIILLLMTVELAGNSIWGLVQNGTSNRATYTSDLAEITQIKEEYEATDTFYRMELAQMRARDDVVWYGLNGMSLFSSTADDRMEKLMGALGFYNAGNKYSYKGATPLTDALFAIRYVISKTEMSASNLLLSSVTDNKYVYENIQCLSVGYVVDEDVLSWKIVDGSPFSTQNDFIRQATDVESALFTQIDVDEPLLSGVTITSTEDDVYYYKRTESGATITWELTFDEACDAYVYFEASHCESMKVIIDGSTTKYTDERGHIVHLGQFEAGDTVTLTFPVDSDYSSGNVKLQLYEYHKEIFEEVYEALATSQWDVTSYDSTHISGSIDVEEDGVLMLSIQYDEGWTILIDGEKTQLEAIGEALMGCYISAGSHTIKMVYSPKGYKLGLLITVASVLLLVGCIYMRKHKRSSVATS